jgi:hypothetical protein
MVTQIELRVKFLLKTVYLPKIEYYANMHTVSVSQRAILDVWKRSR